MRLTSWNLLHGQGAQNFKEIARELNVGNSEFVIGLQEVDAFQDRSDQVFQVAELASELAADNFAFARCVIGTPGFKWRRLKANEAILLTNGSVTPGDNPASYGIGMITNIPVIKWEVLALGKSPVGLPLAFPADSGGKKIRFIYVKDEPRYAIAAQLSNGFTVVNTHLSFVPIVNLIQLFRIKRWLKKMPGKHILLGDLNLPFSIPVLASKWKSLIKIASYPTWQPKIQFDYILSESVAENTVTAISIKSEISDHLPVTIEIS
ncbi:MAG: metal-dependent hydrolase [Actinobacteria bacterium]|nr:metal-dependent hydrolase [Actinomycetota bacterium]